MRSHIAWQREVLALYKIFIGLQLYHSLVFLEYRSCGLGFLLKRYKWYQSLSQPKIWNLSRATYDGMAQRDFENLWEKNCDASNDKG